jgi:hypothetical protein
MLMMRCWSWKYHDARLELEIDTWKDIRMTFFLMIFIFSMSVPDFFSNCCSHKSEVRVRYKDFRPCFKYEIFFHLAPQIKIKFSRRT